MYAYIYNINVEEKDKVAFFCHKAVTPNQQNEVKEREREWISNLNTFIEASAQHPIKDHKASGVIIHHKYPETRRKLVGAGVGRFQRWTWTWRWHVGSFAVAEIHGSEIQIEDKKKKHRRQTQHEQHTTTTVFVFHIVEIGMEVKRDEFMGLIGTKREKGNGTFIFFLEKIII